MWQVKLLSQHAAPGKALPAEGGKSCSCPRSSQLVLPKAFRLYAVTPSGYAGTLHSHTSCN